MRDIVTIPEIQGPAHLSPLAGETVQTTGYVTGVAFNGFYFQDPVGDGDDHTSDGIFVFGGLPLAAGDEVVVTGTASEFIPGGTASGNLSTTQISASNVSPWESGDAPPNPTVIGSSGRIPPNEIVISDSELPTNLQTDPAVFNPTVDGIDFYEALEGMLVTVENPQPRGRSAPSVPSAASSSRCRTRVPMWRPPTHSTPEAASTSSPIPTTRATRTPSGSRSSSTAPSTPERSPTSPWARCSRT